MLKILLSIISCGLLLNASGVPPYKTSLALIGGYNTVKIDELKDNGYAAGVSFKMEEKITNSHFYYGIGADYLYNEFKNNNANVEFSNYSVYPVISYNFDPYLSVYSFAGLNYMQSNNNNNSSSQDSDNTLGLVYGGGIDYKLGVGITHGLMIKQYDKHKLSDTEVSSLNFLYRIGLNF